MPTSHGLQLTDCSIAYSPLLQTVHDGSLYWSEYWPTGQFLHTAVPPTAYGLTTRSLYLPGTHAPVGSCVGDEVGEKVGLGVGDGVGDAVGDGVGDGVGCAVGDGVGMALQDSCFTAAFVHLPDGQSMQSDWPAVGWYLAEAQSLQWSLPVQVWDMPASQSVQVAEPETVLNLPTGHRVHVADSSSENCPMAHRSQVSELWSGVALPASQFTQWPVPW